MAITTTALAAVLDEANGQGVKRNIARIRDAAPVLHLTPAVADDDPDVETWYDDDSDEIALTVTH